MEGQLRSDVETRMSLGLKADVEYVRTLRGSAQDVGSGEFNIPMTQAEYDEMQARWAFAGATRVTLIPYVQELPIFAGAYYDHSSEGDLVILLTEDDVEVRNKISSLAPVGRAVRIEIVKYTERELREAVKSVWGVWGQLDGPQIYSVSVNVATNTVRIEVDVADLEIAQTLVSEVSQVTGVPAFVAVGLNKPGADHVLSQ